MTESSPLASPVAPSADDGFVRLTGKLHRGPFAADNFVIAKLTLDLDAINPADPMIAQVGPVVTIKGHTSDFIAWGETYRLAGRWARRPQTSEMQFEFDTYELVLPELSDAILDFLIRQMPGIGHVTAQKVVAKYGDEALHVLRDEPDRVVAECDLKPDVIRETSNVLRAEAELLDTKVTLHKWLWSVRGKHRIIIEMIQEHGADILEKVRSDPYRLLMKYRGVGYSSADTIAQKHCGFSKHALARHVAALRTAIEERMSSTGCTVVPLVYAKHDAHREYLGEPLHESAITDSQFVVWGEGTAADVQLREIAEAESRIAKRLKVLNRRVDWGIDVPLDGLEEDQREAVATITQSGCSILVGFPGSGKGTLAAAIVRAAVKAGWDVCAMAAYGKAARRLTEQIGGVVTARTIHSSIGLTAGESQKQPRFTIGKPMPGHLFVIDEDSTTDTELSADALEAIPDGGIVLYVGDDKQLPSVGPGAVLRDKMAVGTIPVAQMRTIKRNTGALAQAIYDMYHGGTPTFAPRFRWNSPDNFRFIACDSSEIMPTIREILTWRAPAVGVDPWWDIQIMAPVNEGDFSVKSLNELAAPLALTLAPNRDTKFRNGEKVVQLRNRVAWLVEGENGFQMEGVPEAAVTNGDLGRVIAHHDSASAERAATEVGNLILAEQIRIRNQAGRVSRNYVECQHWASDRRVLYDVTDHGLVLAYCMTVHKLQGSDAPYAIMPLHRSQGTKVITRNLIYTMISRGRLGSILVGDPIVFERALRRMEADNRQTRLVELMREMQI